MATAIIMPRQGQSVESCIITEWQKQKGDSVNVGDVLFSYETDKSSFDEKSEVSGVLLEILADAGDDVPCLDTVCIIGEAGEDITSLLPKKDDSPDTPGTDIIGKADAPSSITNEKPAAAAIEDGARLFISPRAKNLALRAGADLSKVEPTGPMGRIIERDINKLLDNGDTAPIREVENWLAGDRSALNKNLESTADKNLVTTSATSVSTSGSASEPEPKVSSFADVKLTNIRKVIAKSMHASLSEMAQLTLNSSFDATGLLAFRAKIKEDGEALGMANITINDMVLYAAAKTLMQHKNCNAHLLDGFIRMFNEVNLGIAVDTDRGLMVPTLACAQTLSLNELSVKAKSLIKETQSGSISPDKLSGGTFTVTNLGSLGVESFTPVINPPQVCILGVDCVTYKIRENGSTYPAMGLSLTFDHRALDGAPAARFLKDLCKNLEEFGLLLAK